MDDHDVVIAGAGPAGAAVALGVLENSDKSVLMVDRRQHVGFPPQCAGGIVKYWLDQAGIKVPGSVVAARVSGAVFHAPDGSEAVWQAPPSRDGQDEHGLEQSNPPVYILHRERFDRWLVLKAVKAGADLVTGVDASKDGYYDRGRYLVGADGWRSQLGRHFNLTERLSKADHHQGVEYLVRLHKPQEPHFIHLYFGTKVAPTGYIWVFPVSTDMVRIGCGVSPVQGRPRPYLDIFVQEQENNDGPWDGTLETISAGGIIPTCKPARILWARRNDRMIALAGDAARMTDPMHGGGIATALIAGRKLGEMIAEDTVPQYQAWFDRDIRKELNRRYLMKVVLAGWQDKQYNDMVEVMSKCEITDEPVNVQVRRFIWQMVKKKPLLFPKMALDLVKAKWSS